MVHTRLCIVTHTFLPHVGGIERVVYEQSKRLMQRKFEPMVLTSRINTAKQYSYDGIKVQCYDSLSVGFRLGIPYPIPNVTSYKIFLAAVKSSDLVHAHGHPYLSSLLAGKLAKKYKKPFLLTQHNTFIEYNGIWDAVEKANDLAVGKQVLKEAQKIIVVSNATKKYVLSLGARPEKIEVIHNGVDIGRFKPEPQNREETRRKIGIPHGETFVLTVRRLVYKNGIDTLMRAAKTALENNPSLFFLVVGTGPDFNEVKTRVEQLGIGKNFKLAGFVSDADLPSYYNAADLFVLPSKSGEGLPLVGLEAMACGLPLVATDVGGTAEVIIPDHAKLVPPDDSAAMAQAILDFARNVNPMTREKVREIAAERFSWEKNVDRLAKIYEEFI